MFERDDFPNGDGSLSAGSQMIREMHWTEAFAEGEEEKLLQRLERAKEHPRNQWLAMRAKHDRDRLVEGYQPMVHTNARRLLRLAKSRGLEWADLVQEGNIGLLDAIKRYRVDRGSSLRSIASITIRQAMADAIAETGGVVPLPVHVIKALTEARKAGEQLERRLGRCPSVGEVAREIGVTEHLLVSYQEYERRAEVGSVQAIFERCVDGAEDVFDFQSVFQTSAHQQDEIACGIKEAIRVALELLPQRERETVELRCGFGEGPGELRQWGVVADSMGCVEPTVWSRWSRAKGRLREMIAPAFAVGE